jgi:hypothetical protein
LHFTVLGDDEVLGRQAFDRLSLFVFHADRLHNQSGRAAKRCRRRLPCLLRTSDDASDDADD